MRWWRWPKRPRTRKTFDTEPVSIDRLWLTMLASVSDAPIVDRAEALSVPAVQRGRNLICSIATLPLIQQDQRLAPVPNPLLEQFDRDVPNVVTLAQTVEDLLMEGIAWWRITGYAMSGYPSKIRRVDPAVVSLQPPGTGRSPAPLPSGRDPRDAVVWVDGKQVPGAQMIRFDSPNPAVLVVGGRSIRRAILIDKAAAMYADDPRPLDYFTPAEGADPVDDAAVLAILDGWKEARKLRSTAYVPASLTYHTVDAPSPAELQLVELQKQASLDIANELGIDPEDLGVSTTSRTYSNAIDRRRDRINDVLSPYMRAITDRLSMADVTQEGHKIRFHLDDYMRANPTERVGYYKAMQEMGAMTAEEIRVKEDEPPMSDVPAPREVATIAAPVTVNLAADATLRFDADVTEFSVDRSARIVEGLAVPYGKTASKWGVTYRFERGALQWKTPGRVKLLRDHDTRQAIGRAEQITDTSTGLKVRFKVARGTAGDEALSLAEDGVLDGMSIGIDFDLATDTVPDPKHKAGVLVRRSDLREVSLTAMPAFDDARVSKVAASRRNGAEMPCPTCGQMHAEGVACTVEQTPVTPDVAPTFTAEQFQQFMARLPAPVEPGEGTGPQAVDPTRPVTGTTLVREPLPYRFALVGGRHVFDAGEHDFSSDLFTLINQQSGADGALTRVNAMIKAAFDVDVADVADLSPNVHRPDMWQPQMDYATPLWDMVASGTTDGRAFDVPKYNSSSGLVSAATEGTEPAPGAMTVTDQTITPTQVWGKVEITRQAARRGGNPQLSGIIWDQMLREYYEDREAAVSTFLNTLTAAADITLTGTPAATPDNADDQITVSDLEAAIAGLQFVRGGNRFRAFAVHQDLYEVLARVKDDAGRPLYPMMNPTNANGQTSSLYSTITIAGTTAVPAWALGAGGQTTGVNSWLFDPAKVRGWASAPERLDWNFGTTIQTTNIPQLSHVTIGIYGDIALANLDINGVRQVIFDPSV